jgi:ferredoxin
MRVVARRESCCGGGQCVLSAPEVFDQDDSGIVVVLEPRPGPQDEENVRRAVMVCPSGCLAVVED